MNTTTTEQAHKYKARVIHIDDVLPDVRILHIEADNRQPVRFAAGQYALLALPGLEPRPFSIASMPGEACLEFHIRNTGRGESAKILESLKIGDAVTLQAPFGENQWQPSERPLLALAGGMGIAPLKSILQTHMSGTSSPPARLYWGVRTENQLYLDRFFRDLGTKHRRFGYVPVLSDEAAGGKYRTGFIGQNLIEDFPQLVDFDIYMAGPAPMIENTLPLLLQHGANSAHIFSDGVAW